MNPYHHGLLWTMLCLVVLTIPIQVMGLGHVGPHWLFWLFIGLYAVVLSRWVIFLVKTIKWERAA